MLSEVPQGWESKNLEDICEILDKFRVPLNSDERRFRSGSVPYWGANGIVDYIDESIFDEPLLLMPEDGGPFREAATKPICHKIDEPVWVNNHAHVLRVTQAEREFVYQWFVNRDITDYLVGGTRAKLNQKALRKLPILVPPLTEQQRIADILRSVDANIQATQAVIAQTERVQHGLMEELLTGGLGSGTLEQGEVPEGWAQLGEVADIFAGSSAPQGSEFFSTSGYPFVRVSDLGECGADGVIYKTRDRLSDLAISDCSLKKAPKGAVVLPKSGAAIATNRRALLGIDAYIVSHLLALVAIPDLSLNEWIYFVLRQIDMTDYSNNPSYPSLKKSVVEKIKIPLPPLNEQQRIANILSSVDDFMANQKTIIEQLIVTKKGLMDDLLTGRVRTV